MEMPLPITPRWMGYLHETWREASRAPWNDGTGPFPETSDTLADRGNEGHRHAQPLGVASRNTNIKKGYRGLGDSCTRTSWMRAAVDERAAGTKDGLPKAGSRS